MLAGAVGAESQKASPFAAKVTKALETVVVEIEAQEGEGYWSRVVCSLECGKVDADSLKGADIKAAAAITKLLETGFSERRQGQSSIMLHRLRTSWRTCAAHG